MELGVPVSTVVRHKYIIYDELTREYSREQIVTFCLSLLKSLIQSN